MRSRIICAAACLTAAVLAAATGCGVPRHTVTGTAFPVSTTAAITTSHQAAPYLSQRFDPCAALAANTLSPFGFQPQSRHDDPNPDVPGTRSCSFAATDGQNISFKLDHQPFPTPTDLTQISAVYAATGTNGSHIILTPVTINAHRAAFTLQPSALRSGPSAECQLIMHTTTNSVVITLIGPTTTCPQLEEIASQLDPRIGGH